MVARGQNQPVKSDLDPEILQALRKRIHPDRKLIPPIHTRFVTGIEEIIKKVFLQIKKKFYSRNFHHLKIVQ